MERRDHSRIGRIEEWVGREAYRRSSSRYEGLVLGRSPHVSGDSSDPAAYKPSEHVGVMGERRLPHLVIMLCQDSLVILHKHIK